MLSFTRSRPFRRTAGLGLLAQLLLLGLLPVAEALHEHGRTPMVELHADEACAHDGHRSECSLVLRTVPAIPAPVTPGVAIPAVPLAVASHGSMADRSDRSRSPALPRAPPLG